MPSETGRPSRGDDWFRDAAPGSVKRRSVRGALVNAISGAGTQLIGLATLMLLARLLAPADFGLIAMVTAVVGIAAVFQDLGLSGATLRMKQLSHEQVSNLFWINAASAFGMALLVVAAAPALQNFYGHPEVQRVTVVLALGLVLGGLGVQHQALLRRRMRFNSLAKIAATSAVTSSVVSLFGAHQGAGYWALVAGSLAGSIVVTVMAWILCDWRPGMPRRHVGTGPALQFGLHLFGFGVLAFVSKNLHSVVIGRFWGASGVGLYAKAHGVGARMTGAMLRPLGLVVPAVMSSLTGEPDRYRRYYHAACVVAVMAVMPIIFVGLALPEELITVLLGPQWRAAATPLALLSMGFLPMTVAHTTGWVYLSAGDSRAMLRWGVYGWSAMIVATLVGASFGLEGIALATSVTAFLLLPPCLRLAFRGTSLQRGELYAVLAPPVAAAIVAGMIVAGVLQLLLDWSSLARLAAGATAFSGLFALLALTVFGQRRLVVEILTQIWVVRGKHERTVTS